MAAVEVRLFAAARAAAGGTSSAQFEAESLHALRAALIERFGEDMRRVLTACSFLVDGRSHPRDSDQVLAAGQTVDVLPPFAGG